MAGSGANTRANAPVRWSYSRTLEVACLAPKGHSLLTMMLPFGARTRSSGTQLRVIDEPGCTQSSSVVEHGDGVLALTRRTHS